ncbi:MAG: hypothetical protein LBS85_00005, partial [Clostridiales Family XIII bacterium]|nr:hypothetical protein [Clostridiales Family XIII bacterium]
RTYTLLPIDGSADFFKRRRKRRTKARLPSDGTCAWLRENDAHQFEFRFDEEDRVYYDAPAEDSFVYTHRSEVTA